MRETTSVIGRRMLDPPHPREWGSGRADENDEVCVRKLTYYPRLARVVKCLNLSPRDLALAGSVSCDTALGITRPETPTPTSRTGRDAAALRPRSVVASAAMTPAAFVGRGSVARRVMCWKLRYVSLRTTVRPASPRLPRRSDTRCASLAMCWVSSVTSVVSSSKVVSL